MNDDHEPAAAQHAARAHGAGHTHGHGHQHGHGHAHGAEHAHGVIPLDPYAFGAEQSCFGCGPHNPVGLRLRFERDGDVVRTRFTLGRGYDGPPGVLHGGLQALVADELAGWTLVGLRGRIGLTTSMNLRYFRPMRLDVETVAEGRIVSEAPGMATVKIAIKQAGATGCTARISFALPDGDRLEESLGRPLPRGWRPFFDGPDDDTRGILRPQPSPSV